MSGHRQRGGCGSIPVAAPDGAASRVALTAEASDESKASLAGVYLVADGDGRSRITAEADCFAIVNGPGRNATRTVSFYVQGGVVYMDTAVIPHADIGTLHLAGNAVTIPASAAAANIVELTGPTIEQTLLTVPIMREGYPTRIQMSAQIDGFGNAGVVFRVYRGATLIKQFPTVAGINGGQNSAAFIFEDSKAGTGLTQYHLWAVRIASGPYNNTARVLDRGLILQQFKR